MNARVEAAHAAAVAWHPHPSARPYRIPLAPPGVRVRLHVLHGGPAAPLQAPHWPFKPDVMVRVRREMKARGCCVIRVVWDNGLWRACEGSHRIAVASELGIILDLQRVSRDYRLQHDEPSLGVVTAGAIIDVGPKIRGPAALYDMEVVE